MNKQLLRELRDWVIGGGDREYAWDQRLYITQYRDKGWQKPIFCCAAGYVIQHSPDCEVIMNGEQYIQYLNDVKYKGESMDPEEAAARALGIDVDDAYERLFLSTTAANDIVLGIGHYLALDEVV